MDSYDKSYCYSSLDIGPKRKKRRIQIDVDDDELEEELNHRRHQQHHHHHHHQQRDEDCSSNAAYHQFTKRWRTVRKQQLYSSKLLQAIRHVRRRTSSAKAGREIRQTADRVLAVSAKGATRWSRAILSSQLSFNLRKVKITKCSRLRRRKPEDVMMMRTTKKTKSPPVENKLRVLSRLIPGCRKISSLNLLEEATDYISALEMQVRAMTALAAILTGSSPADDRLVLNVNS